MFSLLYISSFVNTCRLLVCQ